MVFRYDLDDSDFTSNSITLQLQSWTKFLGQIYICGAFSHHTLVQPLPPPPPPLQCWKRVHAISPEFQHCTGGRGEEATHFETDNSALLKLRFKNTEN